MKIKELPKSQFSEKLILRNRKTDGEDPFEETLGEFIESSGLSDEATVTELHEALDRWGIQSPFMELYVSIEVTRSRGYTIAVPYEQYSRFSRGELDIDALEPTRFNLEEAYFETEFGDNVYSQQDYAVSDGFGRNLVEWSR